MSRLRSELRWHVKKIARRTCIAASTMLTAASGGVRVLTYHRFAEARHDPFAVAPDAFARQMQWIKQHGVAVSLDDVLDHAGDHHALRDDSVLVTIDDGFESLHSVALPILRHYEIPAVAFIPAGLMDKNPADDDPEARLTWTQVNELAMAGIEIGSHGWSHRSFGEMSLDEMCAEAARSRALLEERIQRDVSAFAYPFGTSADYSPHSAEALRQAGYCCAFTAQHGTIESGADLLELPRVKIEGGESMWAFERSCRGGLDAWRFVDQRLSVLQARHA